MMIRRFCLAAALGPLSLGMGSLYAQATHPEQTYVAILAPLNAEVTGRETRGDLQVTVSGELLTIELDAQALSPGMMHMAHLHGFVSGKDSSCPDATADINHDGIVDLSETEPAAGVTMIPLNAAPASLAIASDTYPVASKEGRITYKQNVALDELTRKMAATFDSASPDLAKRVVFIHGIPATSALPKTVASLPGVPAQVTLPIACGKLMQVK